MNALRPSEVTARVVAWHNRHPLARRIAPAHVQGVGVVALPFALALPEDAAPAAPDALTPIFGADWMYRADTTALGDWVRRHGRYPLPEYADWPHRQLDAELPLAHRADAAGREGRTLRHVLTAVIEIDGHRTRVLVAPQASLARAAVFGQRLASLPRMAALGGPVVAAALGVTATVLLWPQAHVPQAPLPALAAATAASATGAVPAAASAAPPGVAHDAASAAVARDAASTAVAQEAASTAVAHDAASATAAQAHAAVDKPMDMHPMLRSRADGAPPLVQIRPRLTDEEQRQARVQAASVRPAAAASAASAAGHGPVYAIATPALRTRDDALAQQALLQGLKAQVPTPLPTELAVMSAQGRWRVVWFPHPVQREAEDLIVQARARGLKVELIAF